MRHKIKRSDVSLESSAPTVLKLVPNTLTFAGAAGLACRGLFETGYEEGLNVSARVCQPRRGVSEGRGTLKAKRVERF